MNNPDSQLASLQRDNFYAFMRFVFDQLHPGGEFMRSDFFMAMCYALEQVAKGERTRQIITVPPRHLKSVTAAVALPAFLLGRDPSIKIIVASYGSDLAARHARDFRLVTGSPAYRKLFPRYGVNPMRDTALEVETSLRGSYKAVSTGGAVTGFGADVIIIDDLMKAGDARSDIHRERARAYYDETLYSRLNDKRRGAVVAIQQRLHEDDFVAHLLGKGDFHHLDLPAIAEESQRLPSYFGGWFTREPGDILAPALESRETLEIMRREMGPAAFSAQYQQNPTPRGGNRIRWEWFGSYGAALPRVMYQSVVQSWDTAMTAEPTSDWSVCMTFGFHQAKWHLLDVFRRRMDYPDLKRQVVRLAQQWQPETIIIEDAATGKPLYQELRSERSCAARLRLYKPGSDKDTRVEVETGKLEAGLIMLPAAADWLAELRAELLGFPNKKYDDQVDALSQFLNWTGSRGWRGRTACDPRSGRPVGQQLARRSGEHAPVEHQNR